jgi:hypothetical protein
MTYNYHKNKFNSKKNEEKLEKIPSAFKLTSTNLLINVSVFHGIFGTLQQVFKFI